MKQSLSGLVLGLIFGLGLTVSQMINPAKVLGFLDGAGDWDPSLALVLGGAVVVAGLGYRVGLGRNGSSFGGAFQLPSKTKVDRRLFGGAVVFGAGWGLAGLCPGPALTALGTGAPQALIFLAAMAAGIVGFKVVDAKVTPRQALAIDG